MIDSDPSKRPSVTELLDSDLLPPKIEDEYLKDALRIFSNPSTSYYTRMVDAVFKNAPTLPLLMDSINLKSRISNNSRQNLLDSEVIIFFCLTIQSRFLLQNVKSLYCQFFHQFYVNMEQLSFLLQLCFPDQS